MIVIVASPWDQVARVFASRWAAHDIRLLTSQDLSAVGWQQLLGGAEHAMAVVEKGVVHQKEITSVVTRIPWVIEEELFGIRAEDRFYVAREMTAFLLYWLSSLKCRVVNRPTPLCLSGPYGRQESWTRVAVRAGIPVQPVHRHALFRKSSEKQDARQSPSTVTVIGQRVLGETDLALHQRARRLADVAGVELLVVRFSNPECGARFVSADVYPDLSDDAIAGAMLDCLQQRQRVSA